MLLATMKSSKHFAALVSLLCEQHVMCVTELEAAEQAINMTRKERLCEKATKHAVEQNSTN
jgi:hypothetical protein